MGSILASGTLALVFDVTPDAYFGTVPTGSNSQSLVLEILCSFLLMFVISGVTTDSRAVCNPNMPWNFYICKKEKKRSTFSIFRLQHMSASNSKWASDGPLLFWHFFLFKQIKDATCEIRDICDNIFGLYVNNPIQFFFLDR